MQTVKKSLTCFLKVKIVFLYYCIIDCYNTQHTTPEVCVETLLLHFSEITDVYIYKL